MQILLVFALVIAFLAILFAIQNTVVVPINFLFWGTEGSLALILFIALAAGALVSYLVIAPSQLKRRLNISSQRKQIAELESQLSNAEDELKQLKDSLAQIEAAQLEESLQTEEAEEITEPEQDNNH